MSPTSGLIRIRGSVRYCLITTNARLHSSFHSAQLAPLRVVKKGFKRSVNREIKLPERPTDRSGAGSLSWRWGPTIARWPKVAQD